MTLKNRSDLSVMIETIDRQTTNLPLTPIIISVIISSSREGAVTIKNKTSKEMIAIIEADGWTPDRIRGDHHQFVHKTKPGLVTIPHPEKNLGSWLINKILTQAGLK